MIYLKNNYLQDKPMKIRTTQNIKNIRANTGATAQSIKNKIKAII